MLTAMSGRNRGDGDTFNVLDVAIAIVLAALLVTVALAWGLAREAEYNQQADNHTREYAANTYYPAYNACLALAAKSQPDCVAKARNEARDYERDERDLVAQNISALWAYIMGAAAVVGAALSTVGVFLVWTTFHATKAGNEISKSVGEDQTRAYLYARSFVHDSRSVGLPFLLEVRNGGQTPAKQFAVRQMMWIETKDNREKTTPFPTKIRFKNWGSLGPNESVTVAVFREEEVGLTLKSETPAPGGITFNCLGTIRYQTIHNEWFETDFSFLLPAVLISKHEPTKFMRPVMLNMRAFEKTKMQEGIE
jgi:hypothetical protein